jgi:hypothetical protein
MFNTVNLDISDNLIGLNVGALSTSINTRDTGIICERGSTQNNVFAGYKEEGDRYSIFYTSNTSDFSGNNLNNNGYVDLEVENLYFKDASCNNLFVQGTNIRTSLSSEISSRVSGDTSLYTELSSEISARIKGFTTTGQMAQLSTGTGPGYIYPTNDPTSVTLGSALSKEVNSSTIIYVPASLTWTTDVNCNWYSLS